MAESQLPNAFVEAQISSDISFLNCSIDDYALAAPPYNNIRMQALIFTPKLQPRRLLLIQQFRSPDPNAFSDLWTVPAAQPDRMHDVSLMQTLARAVFEQTALTLSHVYSMVGSELVDKDHPLSELGVSYMKVYFAVEVQESQKLPKDTSAVADQKSTESSLPPETLPIKLDKNISSQYMWVDKHQLEAYVSTGLYPIWAKASYEIMLGAFEYSDAAEKSTSMSATSEDERSQVSSPSGGQSSAEDRPSSITSLENQTSTASPRRRRGPNRKPSYSTFISKFSVKDKK